MLVWSLSLYNTIEFKVSFFYAKSRTCSFIDIKLLLREYLETVDSIKEGLLKDKNEPPIFEEIVWSLNTDCGR